MQSIASFFLNCSVCFDANISVSKNVRWYFGNFFVGNHYKYVVEIFGNYILLKLANNY